MESDLFEEAYFVIKDSIVGSQGTTESLVDEANRIIKENIKEKIRRNGSSENGRIILFIIAPLFATLFFALGAIFF